LVSKTFNLFGFQSFEYQRTLKKVIPEMRRVY